MKAAAPEPAAAPDRSRHSVSKRRPDIRWCLVLSIAFSSPSKQRRLLNSDLLVSDQGADQRAETAKADDDVRCKL